MLRVARQKQSLLEWFFLFYQQLCNYILCPKCYKAEVSGYVVIKHVCKSRCVREYFLCEVTCKLESAWSVGAKERLFQEGWR